MSMKSSNLLRTYSIVFACVVALGGAACGSIEDSPTSPSETPAPSPSPGPSPSNGPGRLEVTIDPNPVPWSGQPISGSGCDNVPNTWFYTQVLRNAGGSTIVVSDRTNFFNGRETSKQTNVGITLERGASQSVTTRWCSSSPGPHTAQTNWGSTDLASGAVQNLNGPSVTLRAR